MAKTKQTAVAAVTTLNKKASAAPKVPAVVEKSTKASKTKAAATAAVAEPTTSAADAPVAKKSSKTKGIKNDVVAKAVVVAPPKPTIVKKSSRSDLKVAELVKNTSVASIVAELQSTLDSRSFNDGFSVVAGCRRVKRIERTPSDAIMYQPFSDTVLKKLAARHGVMRLSIAARAKLRELAVVALDCVMDRAHKQLTYCGRITLSRQHAQAIVEDVLGVRVLGS